MKNLPDFTIRENHRAKRIILKVSLRHGLEVVIPRGFDRKQVLQIIREKRDWIQQALVKCNANPTIKLPETIFLTAIGYRYHITYIPAATPFLELIQPDKHNLQISGEISNYTTCQDLLKRWLQHQGRKHIIPWLDQISSELKLRYRKVQIRGQKSRWGSCSSHGTISLNQNLLFLRSDLVRYLIIHELCHTVHLNHSRKFYHLYGQFVPDYRNLRLEMKQAQHLVPGWAL